MVAYLKNESAKKNWSHIMIMKKYCINLNLCLDPCQILDLGIIFHEKKNKKNCNILIRILCSKDKDIKRHKLIYPQVEYTP